MSAVTAAAVRTHSDRTGLEHDAGGREHAGALRADLEPSRPRGPALARRRKFHAERSAQPLVAAGVADTPRAARPRVADPAQGEHPLCHRRAKRTSQMVALL